MFVAEGCDGGGSKRGDLGGIEAGEGFRAEAYADVVPVRVCGLRLTLALCR